MDALNLGTDFFFRELAKELAKDTPHLHEVVGAVGFFGHPAVLGAILLLVAATLLQRRRYLGAAAILSVAAFGFLCTLAINELIGRKRPPGMNEEGIPGASFASPSAFLASLTFFFLATVVGSRMRLWRTSLALSGVCLIVVLALGFSQLYLRMEYLTALLAGWTFGVFTALLGCQLAGLPVPGLIASPRLHREA